MKTTFETRAFLIKARTTLTIKVGDSEYKKMYSWVHNSGEVPGRVVNDGDMNTFYKIMDREHLTYKEQLYAVFIAFGKEEADKAAFDYGYDVKFID